jgi:hypothetical protein
LTVRQPGKPDQRIEVEENSLLLGRHENCDVVIEEGYISNHHVRIMSGIVVLDQKSRNGTYLDGLRLDRPALIQEGDVLTLGKEKLTLEVGYRAGKIPGPSTTSQPVPSPPGEDTWDQRGGQGKKAKLDSMRSQQEDWRGQEVARAQKNAARAVQLMEQAEAIDAKDREIAVLKARIAELEAE